MHSTMTATVGRGVAFHRASWFYRCESLERRVLLTTYVINGTSGVDSWTISADADQITVNSTLISSPGLTDVQVNGLNGNDTLFISHTSVPVVFNGGNNDDQLFLGVTGQMSTVITAAVSYNGGTGSDSVDYRDENRAAASSYSFSGNSLTGPSATASWDAAVETITLYTGPGGATTSIGSLTNPVGVTVQGGTGSDDLSVAMNGSTGTVGFAGGNGAGTDSLTITDNAIGPLTYSVSGTSISRSGRTISIAGVESLALSGTAASSNTFNVGGGDSTMSLALTGGSASDSFVLTAAQFASITVDGGAGTLDSLVVDDRTQSVVMGQVDLGPTTMNRMYMVSATTQTYALSYASIEAWTYYAKNSSTAINVYGTPSSIPVGQQATIICGANADTVTVYPHDADGNLTINGNLGIGGGLGNDKVVIEDAGATNGIAYVFSNPFGAGTQNINGLGTRGFGAGADVENIEIHAGDGEDTFALNTWQSGASLTVNSGGGLDTFDISPTAHSLPAAITNMSSFHYDGGTGDDHFNINNYDNATNWTITRTSSAISYNNGNYFATLNLAHLGYLFASGGTLPDQYFIQSTPADDMNNDLYGAGGNDVYTFGNAGLTSGIASYVNVNGSGGTDAIVVDDTADTTGRTVHIDQFYINTVPSDSLFPAAGGNIYGIIATSAVTGAITVKLGSGADTVYFAPVPIGAGNYSIQGNNPTTLPGDRLTLALAAATSPVFTPGGTGAGSYTFGNRAPMSYTGIETNAIDSIAPTVIAAQYNVDPAVGALPSVDFQFSEDVGPGLFNTHFDAYNSTTTQTFDYPTWTSVYDSGSNTVHYTFSALPGGVLPNGEYLAHLNRVTDVAGNPMTSYTPLDFNVLGADGDGSNTIDILDFNLLAANFGKSGKTFSQGNYDYSADGKVDIFDFNILAANFGKHLDAPTNVQARAGISSGAIGMASTPEDRLFIATGDDSPLVGILL